MRVLDIMRREVMVCTPESTLASAGRHMAEADCGVLPVVDEASRVVGMLTDRDVCITLALRDRRPSEVTVRQAMSGDVYSCRVGDDIREALATMRQRRVRRLPVVDADRHLAGILSLDDVVLEARPFEGPGFTGPVYGDIAETLKAICAQPVPAVGS